MKKQEAGIPEQGESGTAPDVHVCPEGQMWSELEGKCVSVEQTAPETAATAVTTSLMDAIVKTVREHNEQMYAKLRKEQQADIEKLRKELSGEAERALRKSFGLEVDPVIHRSDLADFARKAQLESAPSGKRSPASPGKTGPDGNADKTEQSKDIEGLFKQYKGEK